MATIYYSKRFLNGNLKGLVVECKISMPDNPESIARYAKAVRKGSRGRDVITKARYEIVDASFQNYQR